MRNDVTTSVDALLEDGNASHTAETHSPTQEKAGMPQLDVTSFPSQIFWLVITFTLLYVLLSKSALPKVADILSKRRDRISQDIAKAEQLSADAKNAELAYQEMQKRAKDSASSLISTTLSNVRAVNETSLAKTDSDIVAMLRKTEAKVTARQASLRAELVSVSEQLAATVVETLTGKKVDTVLLQNTLNEL